jgi:hypothetical protein
VKASGEAEPGSFGGREVGFRENQVDASQGGCLPGEIGPAAAPGALEPAAGLVAAGGDARHQGQRGGHGGQRALAAGACLGHDLGGGSVVGRRGQQALRGADHGGGVLGGPGQRGRTEDVGGQLSGGGGPGGGVE